METLISLSKCSLISIPNAFFQQQRGYRIEFSINGTGKCTVFPFKEPFQPVEIPRDAKFATEAYIGGSYPGAGVLVNVFYGQIERKSVKSKYLIKAIEVMSIMMNLFNLFQISFREYDSLLKYLHSNVSFQGFTFFFSFSFSFTFSISFFLYFFFFFLFFFFFFLIYFLICCSFVNRQE